MSAQTTALALGFAALFGALLRAAAPLILAALGGLLSDLAGVINVALEGIMLVAAFGGVFGAVYAALWLPGLPAWSYPLIGCAVGLLAAMATALVLGFVHLELGADLIVTGIVINMLASGLTVFLMATWTGDKGSTASLASPVLPTLAIPGLSGWPLLDALANGDGGAGHHVLVYVAFLAVAGVSLAIFKTRWGLRLRAIGENLDAARAAGLPVRRLRYAALGASGLLAGLGGVYLSMGYLNLFQADMTAGRGFLALAAVFLGARRPLGTFAAAVLFGASTVLAAQLGLLDIPNQVVFMVPPLVTIAAMIFLGARRNAARHPQPNPNL